MTYYLLMRDTIKEILPFGTIWMSSEVIIPSETINK